MGACTRMFRTMSLKLLRFDNLFRWTYVQTCLDMSRHFHHLMTRPVPSCASSVTSHATPLVAKFNIHEFKDENKKLLNVFLFDLWLIFFLFMLALESAVVSILEPLACPPRKLNSQVDALLRWQALCILPREGRCSRDRRPMTASRC